MHTTNYLLLLKLLNPLLENLDRGKLHLGWCGFRLGIKHPGAKQPLLIHGFKRALKLGQKLEPHCAWSDRCLDRVSFERHWGVASLQEHHVLELERWPAGRIATKFRSFPEWLT